MESEDLAPIGEHADTSPTSPTADPAPSPSDRLARMSPTERQAWRQTGAVPGTSAQGDGDGGDGSDPAEAGEDPPVAAPPPSSAPAADASAAGRTLNRRKQTAQERINDLARKNYTLEGELNALRAQLASPSRPAAAAEAPPPASAPSAPVPARASSADPDEPQEENFATYKEYVVAAADYRIQLARQADRAERDREVQQRQFHEVASAHDARVAAFAAAHPDYADVIRNQTDVMPTPLLAEAVLHSDRPAEIAYYLNTHVEEYRALVALAPGPMLKALGKLESRLEADSPALPLPNRISRAPAPPPTLGARPAVPADDVEAAGARGDVGAYLRSANAREIAARR